MTAKRDSLLFFGEYMSILTLDSATEALISRFRTEFDSETAGTWVQELMTGELMPEEAAEFLVQR
jgi:hypothetical protein